jgi:hypothetical protein
MGLMSEAPQAFPLRCFCFRGYVGAMRTAIKWGVFLGVAICVWTLIIHALGFYTTNIAAGQRADIVATILPIAAIVLALRERKKHGPLSFGQALGSAVVVGLVSVPITAGFLWWYHHYMNPAWVDYIVDYQKAAMTAAGATPDAITQMEAGQRASARDSAQITGALIGTTLISLVIGAIAGAVMRTRTRKIAA